MLDLKRKRAVVLYDQLIAANPEIERKGKTVPYTSVNGHMFSQMNKSAELGLRLPKEQREQFLANYNASLFETYGTVMKEYVCVPETLLENTNELSTYLKMAHQYVQSLKPKASAKKTK